MRLSYISEPESSTIMRVRNAFTIIELLVVLAIISVLVAIIMPAVQTARESARKTQCINNLKNIGVALLSYQSAYKVLPPGTVRDYNHPDATDTENESQNTSWVAHVLTQLEQPDKYDRLNFEAWEDPGVHWSLTNTTVARIRLGVLLCPSDASHPDTLIPLAGINYVANLGDRETNENPRRTANRIAAPGDEQMEYVRQVSRAGPFWTNSSVSTDSLRDGTGKTLMISECRIANPRIGEFNGNQASYDACKQGNYTAVPTDALTRGQAWLSSELTAKGYFNTFFVPNDQSGSLGECQLDSFTGVNAARSAHPETVNVLMADGTVKSASDTIDHGVWRALGTGNGSETDANF